MTSNSQKIPDKETIQTWSKPEVLAIIPKTKMEAIILRYIYLSN